MPGQCWVSEDLQSPTFPAASGSGPHWYVVATGVESMKLNLSTMLGFSKHSAASFPDS